MTLDELARQIETRMRTLARVMRTEAPYGTNISALLVLSMLQDGGRARVTELARATEVTQPTMTTLVGRLEKSGLVTRQRSASDGRAVEVGITPEGTRRINEVLKLRAGVLRRRLAALDDDELAAVEEALVPLAKLAGIDPDEDERYFERA